MKITSIWTRLSLLGTALFALGAVSAASTAGPIGVQRDCQDCVNQYYACTSDPDTCWAEYVNCLNWYGCPIILP